MATTKITKAAASIELARRALPAGDAGRDVRPERHILATATLTLKGIVGGSKLGKAPKDAPAFEVIAVMGFVDTNTPVEVAPVVASAAPYGVLPPSIVRRANSAFTNSARREVKAGLVEGRTSHPRTVGEAAYARVAFAYSSARKS
jgi:hypothetical protein